jgi:PII-like signaling protein
VIEDALKLTVYFGEADRVEGELLSDALVDLFGRHDLHAAVLLRGIEGFGIKQRLRTQRLLTLSEDLPLAVVAVDARERVERVVPEVRDMLTGGLVTLERARLLSGQIGPVELPEELHVSTKLTLYLGRGERIAGRSAHLHVVELLRRSGVDGATVLLGVDGMLQGTRRRARFFARNSDVPLMVVSVGAGPAIARALPELGRVLRDPLATLERVRVSKRDGVVLAEPRHLPQTDAEGLALWQKLMVYASEQARHDGHPLHVQLIRRLREDGAAGATAFRGIWGYSGDHAPHGDGLLSLRRRVPVVTTLVDSPAEIRRWWRIVDEVTDEAGLVTSELVPAFYAVGAERTFGSLRLARFWVPPV